MIRRAAARRRPAQANTVRGAPWAVTSSGQPYPSVLSTEEAAALLRISDSAVRALCRRGHAFPRAVKAGRRWWIALGDVSARHARQLGRSLTLRELLEVVDASGSPTHPIG